MDDVSEKPRITPGSLWNKWKHRSIVDQSKVVTQSHPALQISSVPDIHGEQKYAERKERKPLAQVLQAYIETMNSANEHVKRGFDIGYKVLNLAREEFMATVSSLDEERKRKLEAEIAAPTLKKIIEDSAKYGLSPLTSDGLLETPKEAEAQKRFPQELPVMKVSKATPIKGTLNKVTSEK